MTLARWCLVGRCCCFLFRRIHHMMSMPTMRVMMRMATMGPTSHTFDDFAVICTIFHWGSSKDPLLGGLAKEVGGWRNGNDEQSGTLHGRAKTRCQLGCHTTGLEEAACQGTARA